MFSWKRPESVSTQVWHTFESKNPATNEIEEFIVQDLPEKKYEEAIDHMLKHFLPDEPICKSRNVKNDNEALIELCELWKNILDQNIVLACFKKNCDEIIGLNMVCVINQDEFQNIKINIQNGNTWKAVHDFAFEHFNLFNYYKVDRILIAYGLSVSREYRRRGIATEILRARIPLCRAIQIRLTSTVFTAIGSQKSAKNIGFQVNFETPYAEIMNHLSGFNLENLETSNLELMSLVID